MAAARAPRQMLNIRDLDEVNKLLKKHNYYGAKLYELGLSLGLLAPTLDVIKANNVNNTSGYLLECLSAWLRKADDNVGSKGGPTYETLIAALKSIGENAVADAIDSEKHPACMILADHHSTLLQIIQRPFNVAELLHKELVLSEEALAAVKSTRRSPERKKALLKAVQEAVCNNHQNLEAFAAFLRDEFSAAVPVADAILRKYDHYFTDKTKVKVISDEDDCFSDQLGSSLNAANSKEISNEIIVPQHLSHEFSQMQIEFGNMFYEVRNAIKTISPPISIDDLSDYIGYCYPKLVPRLDHAPLLRDVLRIVREKCTLINISLLEGIVSLFNIKEAETHIQKYKKSIATFCEEMKISSCLNEDFLVVKGPLFLPRETARFVLDCNAEDYKLNAVRRFIEEVQGEDSKMQLAQIQETKSIAVTCFFSVSSTALLINRAHANLTVLKEKGLLHLTIGYHTVYDSSKDEAQKLKEEKIQLQHVENNQDMIMSLLQVDGGDASESKSQSQPVNESDALQSTEQQELTNQSYREPLPHHPLPDLIPTTDIVTDQPIQGMSTTEVNGYDQSVGGDVAAATDQSAMIGGDTAANNGADTAATDQSTAGGADTAAAGTSVFVKGWRKYPSGPREVMIIGSFGNKLSSQYQVSPKIIPSDLNRLWKRKEIDSIRKLYQKNPEEYPLRFVCHDLYVPVAERPKKYYLEMIKDLFINCKEAGVIIWYTGHGERNTGNWCFKNGVITFQDIFSLYMKHLKGKSLLIISDCSYSGNWINECIKKLDEIGIPSCGHHTREQGVLLQIITSCQPNEEATALCYIKEGVEYHEDDKRVWHWSGTSGQTPMHTDFREIYCSKPAAESCEINSTCTWEDRLGRNKARFVYLVRGKDKGRKVWHYALVDGDKVDEFKAKVATGTIDVADYGKVLCSGWGKDPPKDIVRKIVMRFSKYINP